MHNMSLMSSHVYLCEIVSCRFVVKVINKNIRVLCKCFHHLSHLEKKEQKNRIDKKNVNCLPTT